MTPSPVSSKPTTMMTAARQSRSLQLLSAPWLLLLLWQLWPQLDIQRRKRRNRPQRLRQPSQPLAQRKWRLAKLLEEQLLLLPDLPQQPRLLHQRQLLQSLQHQGFLLQPDRHHRSRQELGARHRPLEPELQPVAPGLPPPHQVPEPLHLAQGHRPQRARLQQAMERAQEAQERAQPRAAGLPEEA